MKPRQLSDRIGNIDSRLVQEAEQFQIYREERKRAMYKKIIAAAAVLALIFVSGTVGALAFSREIIVEVPVEQESVTFEEIGLTLLLPESWKDRYSTKLTDNGDYVIYNTRIREAVSTGLDDFDGGVLFYIVRYKEPMTEEEFLANGLDFTGYRYLFSTRENTYILYYASDVQWDPDDPEMEAEYTQMEQEIPNIRIVVNNLWSE